MNTSFNPQPEGAERIMDHFKHIFDGLSVTAAFAYLINMLSLNNIYVFLAIVWTCYRIYQIHLDIKYKKEQREKHEEIDEMEHL